MLVKFLGVAAFICGFLSIFKFLDNEKKKYLYLGLSLVGVAIVLFEAFP
jgi:hypothetical protein